MAAANPSPIDPVRVTQRLIKFVLVPISIIVGSILIALQTWKHPEELGLLYRLLAAGLLGGLIGVERQLSGHWAGLRTHMMVSMASALFIITGIQSGPDHDATRVIQGVAAGIGFLGAGTILKLSDRLEVIGLTTASSIWLSAAVGTSAGLALYTMAIATTLFSLIVLAVLLPLERKYLERRLGADRLDKEGMPG
jgi:putative Mg2+ transporter-C (MgtC) family protein